MKSLNKVPFAIIKLPFATCGEWQMGLTTLVNIGQNLQ